MLLIHDSKLTILGQEIKYAHMLLDLNDITRALIFFWY